MNKLAIPMEQIRENDRDIIGSKAFSLHEVKNEGLNVPPFTCITTLAYENYLESSHLKGRIILELARKDVHDMRWEEMWDTSMRIRSMFLNSPIPEELGKKIKEELGDIFTDVPVVVRSSAPGEDSARTSFAGLHESYVNIRGLESIMEHIRLVWASLWSDAALLYREELGLDIKHSSMSVMIQKLIDGEVSGIVFSKSPDNSEQMTIEAVHGLNKGLVDGDVEPDRWLVDRETASIIMYAMPSGRDRVVQLQDSGTILEKTSDNVSAATPLGKNEIYELHKIALVLERLFGKPQDIEWTKKDDEIFVLQSRPITTSRTGEKLWYLSLRRTIGNLQDLRRRIEEELIPAMVNDAIKLQAIDTALMDDMDLSREIIRRKDLYEGWDKMYTDEFIPFAHGMRLFGQVYNDKIKPSNPYEFMDLLSGSRLLSIERNEVLKKLAARLRNDASLLSKAKKNVVEGELNEELEKLLQTFGHSGIFRTREDLLKHIVALATSPEKKLRDKKDSSDMEKRYISAFSPDDRAFAETLLDIGRTSYRLRDDDNIYLGRIENQYLIALNEAKRRVAPRSKDFEIENDTEVDELLKALKDESYIPAKKVRIKEEKLTTTNKVKTRQIRGQPAGEGLVTGIARVITKNEDLFDVRFGEILICDAIDPNMTFVVPLVSGIVERRGGMLIHGAIIAREYGIPCVTGVPEATDIIKNGDEVTVDGYLGIVTIKKKQ